MKVLLINGSPNEKGCTYVGLNEVAGALNSEGIDTEIYHVGTEPIAPCRDCRACVKLGKCVINDKVNEFVEYARNFDGYVIGSPVHYASPSAGLISLLDRAFFSDAKSGWRSFSHKPGAAIVSARRAGTTAALDVLNKYFLINQMPVISGRYWNMVHGAKPEQVQEDVEGLQNMRILGRNMAWHLKCKEAGLKGGITPPETEEIRFTNFVRV